MKNILIFGAEVRDRYTGNRGAEQLLRTVARRVRAMGHQPVVTVGQVDSYLLHELSLKEYLGNPRLTAIDRITPRLNRGGYVTIGALDGVLDASGFALGDAWGMETARWIQKKYEQWSRAHIPIVSLPQSYGPFTNPKLQRTVLSALERCALIFPRDQVSDKNIRSLSENLSIQEVVPDITIAEPLTTPRNERENRLVVVPNWNLLRGSDSKKYLKTLEAVAGRGSALGMDVVGLLHEGQKDLQVLRDLAEVADISVEPVMTGWETKSYIANSRVIVSGRYHAVVGALCTGTPVLTHSWSHKYMELLDLFGVSSWLTEPTDSVSVDQRIADLASFNSRHELFAAKDAAAHRVDEMWKKVSKALK